jgi:hypothetical protein
MIVRAADQIRKQRGSFVIPNSDLRNVPKFDHNEYFDSLGKSPENYFVKFKIFDKKISGVMENYNNYVLRMLSLLQVL